MKSICVVGSLNMDLVAAVEHFPKPGETITGLGFGTFPGGKGANQAVALGRLGAQPAMVGKLGNDLYGQQYLRVLESAGVDPEGVAIEEGTSTGIAMIEVDAAGENHIVIVPGANGKVDCSYIDARLDWMMEKEIFLFQLETPLDTVSYAIKRLKEKGKTIILDPAPARVLPDDLLCCVDYLTPNETELEILSGRKVGNTADIEKAARSLIERGVQTVIAKAGKNGAYLIDDRKINHIPGFKVQVVDTTAAGDSFNAGFAFSLARGLSAEECIRYANAVGALSTTAKGAQAAMPTNTEVQSLLLNSSLAE